MLRFPSTAVCVLLLAAVLLAQGCATTDSEFRPLRFTVIGDGPRPESDWPLLERYFEEEDVHHNRSAFMLHVGDICAGTDRLPESYYERVAALFSTSPIPIVIVPGDNEWNDLDDPDEGWAYWERHFLGFEERFPDAPDLRHQPGRPENVAWVTQGVLFVGINLVGGRVHDAEEWKRRHADNVVWVRENFDQYAGEVRAAVVFCQALPGEKNRDFTEPFGELAASFGKPVLYLHGDGHTWEVEQDWMAGNVLRVMVDNVGRNPPVQVTVTGNPHHPFMFDRHLERRESHVKLVDRFKRENAAP